MEARQAQRVRAPTPRTRPTRRRKARRPRFKGVCFIQRDQRWRAAIWAEDRDVSDPAVLVALAERCGLNGPELLDDAGNQAVREEYRGNTARALAAGVFGSPFYVFAGELFWGQDRLDMLEGAIVRSAPGNLGRGPG